MPRKQKTIHYLYKTTCAITGRYYIGMHSTCNLEDGYMGSGKRIRYSIRKHGKENHVKEILEFFDTREKLVEAEKSLINNELIKDAKCMNLKEGGTGGFSIEDTKKGNERAVEKLKILWNSDEKWVLQRNKRTSESLKTSYRIHNGSCVMGFSCKKHSEETKEKLRKTKNVGQVNSQFGTMWITNGVENKKIKKEDLIPDGWYKGRINLR